MSLYNSEICTGQTTYINGKQVNNNKSYDNMKRLGEFNENLLIYDLIPKPFPSFRESRKEFASEVRTSSPS